MALPAGRWGERSHKVEAVGVFPETLQSIYGYDHPPWATHDVRDCGILLKTKII